LVHLNLSNNNLDPYSGKAIGNALPFNSHLTFLDLSNNRLGNEGIDAILKPIARQKFAIMHGIVSSLLKMKIKRLRFNNNGHDMEIFKLVKAIMIASNDIFIELDNKEVHEDKVKKEDEKVLINESFEYLNTDLEMQEYNFE